MFTRSEATEEWSALGGRKKSTTPEAAKQSVVKTHSGQVPPSNGDRC